MINTKQLELLKNGNVKIDMFDRTITINKLSNGEFVIKDTDDFNPELGECETTKILSENEYNELLEDLVILLVNYPVYKMIRI